ncbi:hypothetical protein ACVWWO_004916 [Bradyrhizobium sp. F1.13.1]
MLFIANHFQTLESSVIGQWSGRSPGRWLRSVGYAPETLLPDFDPERPIRREDLFRLSNDTSVNTLDICMVIFAWGGMTVRNGKAVLQIQDWVETAHKLRLDEIEHIDAYRRFFGLSANGRMKNCGPAYYSKLLMFLPRSGKTRGIIMDQWTARSINLLVGANVVKLTKNSTPPGSYRVSKSNDSSVYVRFYETVQALSAKLNVSVEETEMRLFSEGRGKGSWRTYVRQYG